MTNICPTTGKTKYRNEKEAFAGLERMRMRIPTYEGEPYYCLYCGSHHFGQLKNKKKK